MSQKIFVRSLGGGSGHFICYVIWCLVTDRAKPLADPTNALQESSENYDKFHDFRKFWDYATYQQLHDRYTRNLNDDLDEACDFFKQNLNFFPCSYGSYVASIHAADPRPILLSQENSKLVNITIEDSDINQISYNWVYKTGSTNYSALNMMLDLVKRRHQKLLEYDIINDVNADDKLKTYMRKLSVQAHLDQLGTQAKLHPSVHHFDIRFSEIPNLADNLDGLISYLGLTPSPETVDNVITLIHDYAAAQTKVPWYLSLDSYS